MEYDCLYTYNIASNLLAASACIDYWSHVERPKSYTMIRINMPVWEGAMYLHLHKKTGGWSHTRC